MTIEEIITNSTFSDTTKIMLIKREFASLLTFYYKEVGGKIITSDLPCKERCLEILIENKLKLIKL